MYKVLYTAVVQSRVDDLKVQKIIVFWTWQFRTQISFPVTCDEPLSRGCDGILELLFQIVEHQILSFVSQVTPTTSAALRPVAAHAAPTYGI